MLENVPEEIMNSFSIKWRIDELRSKLAYVRTPKKYHEPLREEIARLKILYKERRAMEKKGRAKG